MIPLDDNGYFCSDNESHFVETWHAMEDLVDEGLTKSIGLSNFNIRQIKEIMESPSILMNSIISCWQKTC